MSWADFTDPPAFLWLLALVPLLAFVSRSLVDRPRWLKWTSFALRALGIALIAAGIAQPFMRGSRDAAHVNLLVDVSASVEIPSAIAALDRIEKTTQQLRRDDSFTLYAVGDGLREMPLPEMREMLQRWAKGASDDDFRAHSRLAEGMLASRMAFPGDKAKRLILFTDGVETDDDTSQALARMSRESIDVRFERLTGLQAPEAWISGMEASTTHAFEGETIRLTARARANADMQAKVRLVHKGVAMTERAIALKAGQETTLSFDAPMTSAGDAVWSTEIVPEKDRFPVNNRAETVIKVQGRLRLLILHDEPKDMRTFASALRSQQVDVDVRSKRGLPATLTELAEFDAVMLSNVAASDITMRQMEMLRQYVSDLGGGLIMLGSENSYGLGGYYKTPVEEVLPLVSRFEKEKEKPSMALALVIDKSGSMEGLPIELARQAAKLAVELLTTRDQAAVIGFDSQPQVICEMTYASDVGSIQAAVDSLAAGGGTDAFPAMQQAGEMLRSAAAKVKHMIVLTDGQTEDNDFPGLVQKLVDEGVTISSVALGDGAARELLSMIAENGRGRYYETADPANVPQIFTRETMQASRTAIQEDLFPPQLAQEHPLLAGVKAETLPEVLGYVMTQAKPTAQTLLQLETGDPLLAVARYGLGSGLAYTSDLTDKWGAEWLSWDSCGSFWAQLLRGVARKSDVDGLEVHSSIERGKLKLAVVCTDANGARLSGVKWDAALAESATGAVQPVSVAETGLGQYEAVIPLAGKEAFAVRLHDVTRNKLIIRHHRPAYPDEYQLQSEPAVGFAALAGMDPVNLVSGLKPVETPLPLQAAAYLLGLLMLLGSIALRRIS